MGMWRWMLLFSPTVWAGSGRETRDTQTHTEERARKCWTYPLATYPLKSARSETSEKILEFALSEISQKVVQDSPPKLDVTYTLGEKTNKHKEFWRDTSKGSFLPSEIDDVSLLFRVLPL